MTQWQEKDFTLRWARQWMISDGMKKPSPHTVPVTRWVSCAIGPYERSIVEQTFGRIIELFVPEWLQRVTNRFDGDPGIYLWHVSVRFDPRRADARRPSVDHSRG